MPPQFFVVLTSLPETPEEPTFEQELEEANEAIAAATAKMDSLANDVPVLLEGLIDTLNSFKCAQEDVVAALEAKIALLEGKE